ncbi:MAG: DUF5710 domain-containing protein [Blautia sp.]|nr:DUF5710 domain-containing protein [Lachnoclostridium sp.]MCM1210936.1 DUF5710 domain-containing protein [Blautia sp.]
MSLFLDIPYSEKEEAKKLGAKWNPKVKKWYTNDMPEDYTKFSKWILKDSDNAIIATEYIYIIEGQQNCWKCKRSTKIIGLGIGKFFHMYKTTDGNLQYEFFNDYIEPGAELHLAWVEKEEDIPPKLLHYIKENYSVKTGYSKTLKENCFSNYCDCCNSLQGNWFLFDEPNSPLSSNINGNSELIERISKLKIYGIPIEDDLQLNWSINLCSNDYSYFKYGKFKELILSSNPENDYISYKELYNI